MVLDAKRQHVCDLAGRFRLYYVSYLLGLELLSYPAVLHYLVHDVRFEERAAVRDRRDSRDKLNWGGRDALPERVGVQVDGAVVLIARVGDKARHLARQINAG